MLTLFESLVEADKQEEDTTGTLDCQGPTDEVGHAFFAKYLVPPEVNVYLPDQIWVWARLVEDGPDLDIEDGDIASIGRMTPAFEYVMEDGLKSILGIPYGDQRHMRWALENGIAPGQPFLVWVGQPRFSRDDYHGEVDVDFDHEVVRVLHRRKSRITRRWDRAIRHMQEDRVATEAHRKLTLDLERSTIEAMFLRRQYYWSSGAHDEMAPPNGVRVSIFSDHSKIPPLNSQNDWGGCIASGQDDEGDLDVALQRLVCSATKIVPTLDEAKVRSMPWRMDW